MMKQSTFFVGFILLSIAVLYTEATSTGHDELPPLKQYIFEKFTYDQDNGQIETCDFQKAHFDSALRVTYQGDLRLRSCLNRECCRRWFITINGEECSSPAPIDAVIYAGGVANLNLHRPGTLDGFCNNIPKGNVTVGLSVGKCKSWSYDVGDAATGWNSVARLIIEEIPSMQ